MKSSRRPSCPCGTGRDYAACCGVYHAGLPAADAEALMRSRYSAFVLNLEAYLLATWHPDTRPERLELVTEPRPCWFGLTVSAHQILAPDQATVEFIARYKLHGRAHRLHEISRFVQQDGLWFYLDGQYPNAD